MWLISEIQNFFNKKTRPENNWNKITDLKNTGKDNIARAQNSRNFYKYYSYSMHLTLRWPWKGEGGV